MIKPATACKPQEKRYPTPGRPPCPSSSNRIIISDFSLLSTPNAIAITRFALATLASARHFTQGHNALPVPIQTSDGPPGGTPAWTSPSACLTRRCDHSVAWRVSMGRSSGIGASIFIIDCFFANHATGCILLHPIHQQVTGRAEPTMHRGRERRAERVNGEEQPPCQRGKQGVKQQLGSSREFPRRCG